MLPGMPATSTAARRIAISLGDPSGIGPEIVARALAARPQIDALVYGDAGVLAPAAIASAAALTAEALARRFGIAAPRVAVAGLNPHAGEAGRFGDEEERLVRPALDLARRRLEAAGVAATLTGPHVPDVVFR